MNNSDFEDFNAWQNGDGNPNDDMSGFFYYGNVSDKFKKLWEQMHNKENYAENMAEYLNMQDFINQKFEKGLNKNLPPRKQPKKNTTIVSFTQDEYLKLIEIRGYLAITEQFAHVKALDKVLNQIKMIAPKKDGK